MYACMYLCILQFSIHSTIPVLIHVGTTMSVARLQYPGPTYYYVRERSATRGPAPEIFANEIYFKTFSVVIAL